MLLSLRRRSHRFVHFPSHLARSNATFYGQKGMGRRWSCGYRNLQMLCAWLLKEEQYRGRVFRGVGHVISLSALQREVEAAWRAGFDRQGGMDFGYHVVGGSAWIGTSELWAVLRSYGIRAKATRFSLGAPAAAKKAPPASATQNGNAKRPRMVQTTLSREVLAPPPPSAAASAAIQELLLWVWRYFENGPRVSAGQSGGVHVVHRPPLYLQHAGHSRTIVGIERRRDKKGNATYMLLVLDPAVPRGKLLAALNGSGRWQPVGRGWGGGGGNSEREEWREKEGEES